MWCVRAVTHGKVCVRLQCQHPPSKLIIRRTIDTTRLEDLLGVVPYKKSSLKPSRNQYATAVQPLLPPVQWRDWQPQGKSGDVDRKGRRLPDQRRTLEGRPMALTGRRVKTRYGTAPNEILPTHLRPCHPDLLRCSSAKTPSAGGLCGAGGNDFTDVDAGRLDHTIEVWSLSEQSEEHRKGFQATGQVKQHRTSYRRRVATGWDGMSQSLAKPQVKSPGSLDVDRLAGRWISRGQAR